MGARATLLRPFEPAALLREGERALKPGPVAARASLRGLFRRPDVASYNEPHDSETRVGVDGLYGGMGAEQPV
jgi:hypothetical protein